MKLDDLLFGIVPFLVAICATTFVWGIVKSIKKDKNDAKVVWGSFFLSFVFIAVIIFYLLSNIKGSLIPGL